MNYMWRIRFLWKRIRQQVQYLFSPAYYEIPIGDIVVKLGCDSPYHAAVAREMSRSPKLGLAREGFIKYPAKLVYDIGGYNGICGISYALAHPESKVVIFEPSVQNYWQIDKNIFLNKVANCEVRVAAIGEKDGVEKFSQGPTGGEGISENGEYVDMLALSSLPHADLIKLDSVGAEVGILRGLNYKPIIRLGVDMSQLKRYGDTEKSLWEEVERHGYKKWFLYKSALEYYVLF